MVPGPNGGTELALPIPEKRGFVFQKTERDPAKKYTPASYAAQFGVPLEDAEELVARNATHHDVVRDINRLFSADPNLKARALNPFAEEQERAAKIRAKEEEARARRITEQEAAAKRRRDRLRREMLGMAPEDAEVVG